jgi:hypothetical protein
MNVSESTYVGRDFYKDPEPNTLVAPTQEEFNDFENNVHDDNLSVSGASDISDRSDKSHRSDGSRNSHRSSQSRSSHGTSSSSHDDKKRHDSEYIDYNLVIVFGCFLLAMTAAYFYWIQNLECTVVANDETNLTIQYALDNFSLKPSDHELDLSIHTKAEKST